LNQAAGQSNDKDIHYLVNCGNKIDDRKSIFNEAPIHKAVLSFDVNKPIALKTIIDECNANVNNIDANGWSALHHACYTGCIDSARTLIESDAKVNAFSNQNKTPLHLAALNNHVDLIELLLDSFEDPVGYM